MKYGNKYLEEHFPGLDKIKKARIKHWLKARIKHWIAKTINLNLLFPLKAIDQVLHIL
jgi:hypothetical protein